MPQQLKVVQIVVIPLGSGTTKINVNESRLLENAVTLIALTDDGRLWRGSARCKSELELDPPTWEQMIGPI
jgi:hypothetical protein